MQKVLRRLFPWQIRWKGVLYEALILLAAYIVWLIFRSPNSPSRNLIGSLAILTPLAASTYLVLRSLPGFALFSRRSWYFLALALACLTVGNSIRVIFITLWAVPLPQFFAADVFNLSAYPLIFIALILYPFENRYAPSRFRFFLDATISSGVVATLGWLILAPSLGVPTASGWVSLVPLAYPISDLVLLMILMNMLLANRKARRTSFLWGISLLLLFISDYYYSLQVAMQGFQLGDLENLGWTIGFMLFGIGALVEIDLPVDDNPTKKSVIDLGARLQNILPVTLVLLLFWYVLIDWQYRGIVSSLGLWMSLILSLGLIIRMGIRAGESELHKYWQLFSNLADPTFICDVTGRIVLGNPALVKALGYRNEGQVIGQSLGTIFDLSGLPADMLQRAARQDYVQEVLLQSSAAPYQLSLSPVASEGRKMLIAGVAYDLSVQKRQQNAIQQAYEELKVVYRQLEELNTQLEQKVEERTYTLSEANRQLEEQNKMLQALDQLKSDFVSMVSHELRTPLTSLTGGLELLLNRKHHTRSDQTTLFLMKNEIQRLTRFVENILNLSAMEAGRLELHPGPMDLSSLLTQVIAKLNNLPGIERIQVKLARDLPEVLADEAVLQSIFNHIIDNALKYANLGAVLIEAYCERNKVRVQVTDSGPGIPKEKQRLLFQRFQRLDAKDSQSVYGYGLGLYLSRRMLQAMSSDLAYETPQDGGARFYFYLKAAR